MIGATDYIRVRAYYNSLVRFNDDLTLSPEIAEEWSANDAVTEWTFKLRKGVEFHDGKTLDADDVIYSMNRHLGPDSVSKGKSLVSMVTEWKKIDQYTVKAIMDSPNADLPAALGTFHFKIVENGAEGEYFHKPNGTGPFKSKEFNPGIRALGVRNENYWVDGRPYLDELETFAITDPSARTNAAIAGDVDVAGAPDPNAFKLIEESDNVELLSIPSANLTGIVCMMDRAPGNNPDFVLGLKYLQNRERIVRTLMKGHAIVGNDHPISPAYPDHCSELPIREYDPDKAKFHLQKSGISEATVLAGEVRPGVTDFCLMLQAEARKVGFTLNVKKVPTDGYWGTVWMNTPVCATGWNMRPSANLMLTPLRLQVRRGLERVPVEPPALRPAPAGIAGGKGCRHAPRDVLRDAADHPGRRRAAHSLPHQLRGRGEQEGQGPGRSAAQQRERMRVARVRLARHLIA